jgi:hypothetical protein
VGGGHRNPLPLLLFLMGLEALALKLAADLPNPKFNSRSRLLSVQHLPKQKCGFHAFLYLQVFRGSIRSPVFAPVP